MFDLRLDLHEGVEGEAAGGTGSNRSTTVGRAGSTGSTGGLLGTLTYDTRLFKEATVARMAAHFARLLAAAAVEPDVPVGKLDMLPAEERAQLLVRGEWDPVPMIWLVMLGWFVL
jgi:non-ribosomal peptide synthetase component F